MFANLATIYRGLNDYQYYFGGFLVITIVEWTPNPILIIKSLISSKAVCSKASYSGSAARRNQK